VGLAGAPGTVYYKGWGDIINHIKMRISIKNIYRMYLLSFLFTLQTSLSAYVNSTFLTGIIPEHYVGVLYTIASLLTLILLSESSFILKHFGNKKFILTLLFVNMFSLVGMITSHNPYVIGASFIGLFSSNTLVFFSIDIFIQHFGNPKTIGHTRGFYLTVQNIAWLISPLITAILITQEGGYLTIYRIALLACMATIVGVLFSVRKFTDRSYKKTPFLDTYRYLKKNRHMLAITTLDFILQFFYVWMVVYTPIYLHTHLGFGWADLGVIFTIMLAPFVLFEFPVGVIIDKYHVRKRLLLYIGFIIMGCSTFVITFVTSHNIAVWALILFLTRMGAAIVESTAEIYFFTHVTEEDAFLLGVFRDMSPVAYIIAPLIATAVFSFLPFRYLFIVLTALIFTSFYYIRHLKHNHIPLPDVSANPIPLPTAPHLAGPVAVTNVTQ
jgi:MFS family permease